MLHRRLINYGILPHTWTGSTAVVPCTCVDRTGINSTMRRNFRRLKRNEPTETLRQKLAPNLSVCMFHVYERRPTLHSFLTNHAVGKRNLMTHKTTVASQTSITTFDYYQIYPRLFQVPPILLKSESFIFFVVRPRVRVACLIF